MDRRWEDNVELDRLNPQQRNSDVAENSNDPILNRPPTVYPFSRIKLCKMQHVKKQYLLSLLSNFQKTMVNIHEFR